MVLAINPSSTILSLYYTLIFETIVKSPISLSKVVALAKQFEEKYTPLTPEPAESASQKPCHLSKPYSFTNKP